MWHLLQSFHQNYKSFWARLLLVSFAVHLLLIVIMFFYKSGDNIKLTLFAKKHDVEVVFLPIYKTVPNVQKKVAQSKKRVPVKKTVAKKKDIIIPKSKSKPKLIKKAVQKKVVKKKVTPKKKKEVKEQVKKKQHAQKPKPEKIAQQKAKLLQKEKEKGKSVTNESS